MTIDIITVRGAGELGNHPNNMLANVVRRLDKQRFRHIADLSYPAAVGPVNSERNPFGPSLSQSLVEGKRNLAETIRRSPNRVGVLGFSLGAYVVSDFLQCGGAVSEKPKDPPNPPCHCGKWQSYVGIYGIDGYCWRCRGCLRRIDKCWC